MGTAENILKFIKLSPKYILPVVFLSAALLLLPDQLLGRFGLDGFVAAYRMWIGLAFFASGALLLSHLVFWVKDKVAHGFRTRRFLRAGRECLRKLTPEEKRVLSDFILLQSKTQMLDIRSGVTRGLEHANIIYRCTGVGTPPASFAYNLQPWAWEELNVHTELLEPELSERCSELQQI